MTVSGGVRNGVLKRSAHKIILDSIADGVFTVDAESVLIS